jgi:phosphoesterase RecJ-like protein
MNLKNTYKKVYNEIKKYDTIYVARHIGPDPDAIASQISLRDSIISTFPNKKVYAIGISVSKYKYFGKLDNIERYDYENSLIIIVDTPDKKRVDVVGFENFKNIIKIDHHPLIDDFGGLELIDTSSSSAAQVIMNLISNTKLIMNKSIASNIFMGIVSDSNRFLFDCTSSKTIIEVGYLIEKYKIDIQELYKKLYAKPLSELRLMGYIASNIKVTKNKFAYINIENDIIKSFGADASSASNMINDFNNINEIICWMFITRDEKNDIFKIHMRSRGPVINEVAMKYNGGGHKLASGARIKEKEKIDELTSELDDLCRHYIEKN